jgi:hypothetical protein
MTRFVQWFRSALSKGPIKVDVFLPSPEDGNRSSFRNVVFLSLESLTMNKAQTRSNSACHTTSSEAFKLYVGAVSIPKPQTTCQHVAGSCSCHSLWKRSNTRVNLPSFCLILNMPRRQPTLALLLPICEHISYAALNKHYYTLYWTYL